SSFTDTATTDIHTLSLHDALPIYEAHPDFREKEREIDQARNIQKMMEKYPDEKFLVYCGHGHVYEGSVNRWEKAMAGRLKEYTNEDPLSINQDYYSEKSNPIYNPPLLKAVDIDQPSVLLDENDQVLNIQRDESWVDIA